MRQIIKKPEPSWYRKFRRSRFCRIMYDRGGLYFLLAFLIPAVIMLYAFEKKLIHPFGSEQILVVDLWHQYFPFFRVVREKLLSGGSFLYSWQNGIGTNFLALIAYYAASPLNWISIYFDDDNVRDALTYILLAKIGFAGAFAHLFLRYTYKRRDFSTVVFGSMFALCSYTLGYYWNVMWFDTIALFPLVMTGVVALCREKKWTLYTIALALSLVSNYYIGYFTCIFTIFMFASAVINEGRGIRDFFAKLWLIVRSTVIGIGLGGAILLPAYLALQLTYSANNHFPTEISWYEKWTDIFANLLSYSEPTAKEGLPNLACGMLAVTLFGVFLFSAGIKLREKISMTLMLALIAVSCNMNVLNFIWHGFHVTNQLPYRFAFIFSFVLIAAAYRAYDVISRNGIKLYQLFLLIPGPAAVFGLNFYKAHSAGEEFVISGALKSSMIITGAYILIFAAVKLFPFNRTVVQRTVLNLCIAAAVFSELVSNAALGVKTVGSSSYTGYPYKYEQVEELLDDIRREDRTPFYRTEMTGTYTLNDSALYGYYGVSQFSSSANVSVTRLFHRLGLYASEAGNRYYYRTSTPPVNSLLGIKYLISRSGMINSEEMALEHVGSAGESSDQTHLYENKYHLSLGFMMNEDILSLADADAANPFEYQNDVLRLASGCEDIVFTPQPVALAKYNNIDVQKNGYGDYSFVKSTESGSSPTVIYDFSGVEDSYLYGYASNSSIESLSVRSGGTVVENSVSVSDYPIVFPMGNGQEGVTAEITVNLKEASMSGSYKLMIYALKQQAFESVYEALADEQLKISDFTDTRITGSIEAKESGILYLQMPYEKGWHVYVDGHETETLPVMNAMLGARVSAGHHDIVLKYSPDGFGIGLAISGGAAALFLLMILLDMIRRKKTGSAKNIAAPEQPKQSIGEMTDVFYPEVKHERTEKPESNDGLPRD